MSLHAVLCGLDMAATLEFFKICSHGREQPAALDLMDRQVSDSY
jgi:hypothetical protein